ncbi:uncharacterized protein (DUF305 family) [Mycobacterium sp. BK558]|nr:DUF305 domain-containing protein [Mycolicibacterium rufum]RZT24418.1 uncharacterized protein (DUF305 family) [Mycobacterium sp. BK558]
MMPIARVVAAVFAAVMLAGCGSSGSSSGGAAPTSTDTPVITGEPAGFNAHDVTFAQQMIDHHRQAVAMAKLVPDRSTNAQLAALAARIAEEQQSEINTLNVFLVQWNEQPKLGQADQDAPDQSMPGMVDPATITRLESLRGPEFDRLWLQSMVGHHQGAIEMAKAEIATGENVDAVSMAKTMVSTQQAEIGQMNTMLEGNP